MLLTLSTQESQNESERFYHQQNSRQCSFVYSLSFSIHRAFWEQIKGTELMFSFSSII